MDEKINSILNDPEKMKAAFEMASQFVGNNGGQNAPKINTDDLAATFQKMRDNGSLDGLINNLSNKSDEQTQPPIQSNPTLEQTEETTAQGGISAMLPNILKMLGSNDGGAVNPDRANLLNAIKPYINTNRSGNIDRAVNVANMAKNAKSVLGGLKK